MGFEFEWDDAKEQKVFLMRGITFTEAIRVFSDDDLILWQSASDTTEERFVAVGIVEAVYLATVFTFRGDAIRIITVRPARRKERVTYDDWKNR